MRAALWLMSLFAVAVASALLASNNVGTVSIFLTPYRFDVSLNLVLCALVLILLTLHWAQRALTALFELPKQAKRWRLLQKERAAHAALLEGALAVQAVRVAAIDHIQVGIAVQCHAPGPHRPTGQAARAFQRLERDRVYALHAGRGG